MAQAEGWGAHPPGVLVVGEMQPGVSPLPAMAAKSYLPSAQPGLLAGVQSGVAGASAAAAAAGAACCCWWWWWCCCCCQGHQSGASPVVSGSPFKHAAVPVPDRGLRRIEDPKPRLHTLYEITPVLPPECIIVAAIAVHSNASTCWYIARLSMTCLDQLAHDVRQGCWTQRRWTGQKHVFASTTLHIQACCN
jgi:hypothetical protein